MSRSPYLTAYNLSASFGSTRLFENLCFTIHPGERWGIVGPNGAGKSTLFRILQGVQQADSGTVSIRNGIRVAILSQQYDFQPNKTVITLIKESLPIEFDSEKQTQLIEADLESHALLAEKYPHLSEQQEWLDKLNLLQEKLLEVSKIGTENMIQSALKLGLFTEIANQQFGQLSGGQQKRVQIICALIKNPHLILLDEPTNHLDVQTVDWLEELLLEIAEQGSNLFGFKNNQENSEPIAFAIISHDRSLLDTLTHKILEIEAGEFKCYQGNYEAYSQAKLENQAQNEKTKAKMQNLMRRELEWLRAGTKARTTKQQSRIDRALSLNKELQAKQQRAALFKKTEINFQAQMQSEQRDFDDCIVPIVQNLGQQELIHLKNVSIAHPSSSKHQLQYIFNNLNLIIKPKSRIAILGPNGCGKSTLMKYIANFIPPENGEIKYHDLIKIAYFDQQRHNLDPTQTVRATIAPEGEYVFFEGKYLHIMSYLERFLFNKYDAQRTVANLSGGEKARLLLAKLMLEHANMLILDEPTNDLDIPTLHILERSLMEFQGGILFTSHDRYFMQRVATAVLTNTNNDINYSKSENKWTLFADLDQALNQILNTNANTSNLKAEPVKTNSVQNKSPKPNSNILKEIVALENKINALEHKINELTQKLNELYYQEKKQQEIVILSKEVEGCQSELNNAYLQWENLMSKNI